jgi:uncharacterized membrane protein SpoIIM required for sporulation
MATTDASKLALVFPGGVKAMGKDTGICSTDIMLPNDVSISSPDKADFQSMGKMVDIIEMSFITRLVGNPYLSITWVVVTFLIIFVQILSAIHTLPNNEKNTQKTEDVRSPGTDE